MTPAEVRPSDEAYHTVRALLRSYLGADPVDGSRCGRGPQELVAAALAMRVIPHVDAALSRLDTLQAWRKQVKAALKPYLMRHFMVAMRLHDHAAEVLGCLRRARIPVIPFKGTFISKDVYGDPCFRGGKDIDLLLANGQPDLEPACEALCEMGYARPQVADVLLDYYLSEHGQLPLIGARKKLPPIDLHHAVYDDLPPDARKEIVSGAVMVADEDPPRLRPAHLHLLLLMAVHYWRHPTAGQTMSLVDVALLCRREEIFREGWRDTVRAWRMGLYLACTLEAARYEFGVEPAPDVLGRLRDRLRPEARDICDRIARRGPDSLPFGVVQRAHRLSLPWRRRIRAVRRSLWPHPGRILADAHRRKGRPSFRERLAYAWEKLLKALRPARSRTRK